MTEPTNSLKMIYEPLAAPNADGHYYNVLWVPLDYEVKRPFTDVVIPSTFGDVEPYFNWITRKWVDSSIDPVKAQFNTLTVQVANATGAVATLTGQLAQANAATTTLKKQVAMMTLAQAKADVGTTSTPAADTDTTATEPEEA